MPIPFILGAAAVGAAIFGAKKMIDSSDNNSRAEELQISAKEIYDEAIARLEYSRENTNEMLEQLGTTKVDIWANDMNGFIDAFSKFKNVKQEGTLALEGSLDITPENIKAIKKSALKASEMVNAGLGSLAAGTLAGVAAYGGASMFAAASTGTAISTLSGAAATNATLAFFGGGSIASGGLGVAAGSAVLGGVVLGPALALAGMFMSAKSEENLAKAEKMYAQATNAAEKMNGISDTLDNIYSLASDYNEFLMAFSSKFKEVITGVNRIYIDQYTLCSKSLWNKIKAIFGMKITVDYNQLERSQQQYLHMAWLMAQTMQKTLTVNLLDEQGNITAESYKVLQSSQQTVNSQLLLNQGRD